jgi:ABC-2 type transport system permease protein
VKLCSRILAIARVETTRVLRSRSSLTLLLMVPALQVLLFGYAIQPQSGNVSVVVAGPDSSQTEEVLQALRSESGTRLQGSRLEPGMAEAAVRAGHTLIGVELPLDGTHPMRIFVDATNAVATEAAATRISAAFWQNVAARSPLANAGPTLRIERLYNPTGRADWTFLPALVGVTVMISMIMLGALSLARERESGTWETLLSLPFSRVDLILGKALPYLILGTVQGILVLAAGVVLFSLPARGSVAWLIGLLPIFAATHFMLGYAISARASTQLEAVQGAIAYYLPAMLLSGFLYPFEALPHWAQNIGRVFPLTHFVRAAREVLLQGRGPAAVVSALWPILAFGTVAAIAGLLLQNRRLK